MCGITGWVDFDGTGPRADDVLAAMTATMQDRGPDAGGTWTDGTAAIGHRRLAVVDPAGGHQPMVADEEGRVLAVISYSGEVYGFGALREELRSRGHRFRTASDTEVVLRGFVEWGAALPDHLTGMFAFAVWAPRERELLLVRDRLGVKPLYWYPTPSGVVFGSEPKALLAHPAVPARLGPSGLRELMTWSHTPGHAIFEGMRQVRPGHVVRVRRGGTSETAYWTLPAHPHSDTAAETAARVRTLLQQAVSEQTVADVPLCSMLSGGLDSSSVSSFAATALRARGERLRTFCVEVGGAAGEDVVHARAVADGIGSAHVGLALDDRALTTDAARAAVLRARDLPVGLADMDTSLHLLFRTIRERSTVALSGEGADELFGGYPWFADDEAKAAPTFPWTHQPAGAPVAGGPSLLAPDLADRFAFDEYRADVVADAEREVPVLDGEDRSEALARRTGYLALTRFLPMLLDRKDRMSMATGLEVRVPFCDHRLVEYVFNVPWAMKSADRREKSLLRAAVAEVVPDAVLARPKSNYPSTADPGYDLLVRDRLGDLVAAGCGRLAPLVHLPTTREAYAGIAALPAAQLRFMRMGIEFVLRFETWMRTYDVELAL